MASTGLKAMFIAVLALFSALVHAWGGLQYCGASTFTNPAPAAPPLLEDCQTLMTKIQYKMNRLDAWGIGTCQPRVMAYWGTCRFGMQQAEPHPKCEWGRNPSVSRIGYGDMVYAINESIIRYGRDGRVSAKGFFMCNPDSGYTPANMQWSIY